MSEPRLVIRGDGGAALVREVDGGEPEVFEVPPWVIRHLAKGRWWMEVFAIGLDDRAKEAAARLLPEKEGARRFLEGAVASPAPLDVERLERQVLDLGGRLDGFDHWRAASSEKPSDPDDVRWDCSCGYAGSPDTVRRHWQAHRLEGQPVAEEPA